MEIKRFKTFKEFAQERIINRTIYKTMTYDEKCRLKFYIYYVLKEKQDKKDIIWEYLNEPMDTETYLFCSIMINKYLKSNKKGGINNE